MKIVIVTSRFPWPLEKGDKLRIFHQLKFLARRHEIFLISIVDEDPAPTDLAELEPLCHKIQYFRISKTYSYLSALRAWVNGRPAQVGYFFNPGIKKKVYEAIIDFQPDRIFCQLIRVSEYVKTLPFVKVLDFMDTFSAGMSRQAESRSGFLKHFYKREARLIRKYEREVYSYFDSTTIISERDKSELPILSRNLVQVIQNGIDTEFFQPPDEKPDVDLLFVGNLGYKPNEQAVLLLLNWYRKSNFSGAMKVLIAGARPTSAILAIDEPGWEVTGWVDDIRDAYHRAGIFVAPLTTGSGLQNKLLEAMACALPCVTTSLVNDSIGARDGQEIFIADDHETFKRCIEELSENAEKRHKVGQNARNFVLNNYRWDEFNSKLEKIIVHAKSRANI